MNSISSEKTVPAAETAVVRQLPTTLRSRVMGFFRFPTPIEIRGDASAVWATRNALKLLQDRVPEAYAAVVQSIGIIDCQPQGSGMHAAETLPRFVVGEQTRHREGTVWYAGAIVHDAEHSRLYRVCAEDNPGKAVPDTAWCGEGAEAKCLKAQHDALSGIGASAELLDRVENALNNPYYTVPVDERWW